MLVLQIIIFPIILCLIQKAEKIVLLKEACGQHTKLTQEAMTGQGIDRHLFSLYVISKYLEIESPFLAVSPYTI